MLSDLDMPALTAKEAVFKAQYPITRRKLDYDDVRLRWTSRQGDELVGMALCEGIPALTVRSARSELWLLSVAYLPSGQ